MIKDTDIEAYLAILRGMDIEIIDASEVERFRSEHEQEEQRSRSSRMDFFDDPIRMYLHQMGQVPLLTREQEIEICKRIEVAESKEREMFNQFAFTPRLYLELLDRLETGTERFDRVVTDKFSESRDVYMEGVDKIKKNLLSVRSKILKAYDQVAACGEEDTPKRKRAVKNLEKARQDLFAAFHTLNFKQKILESLCAEADEKIYRPYKTYWASVPSCSSNARPKSATKRFRRSKCVARASSRSSVWTPRSFSFGSRNCVTCCVLARKPEPRWSRPICVWSSASSRST